MSGILGFLGFISFRLLNLFIHSVISHGQAAEDRRVPGMSSVLLELLRAVSCLNVQRSELTVKAVISG